MNFSLRLWSFDDEKEWQRFLSFYLSYLQKTCRAEEYAEEEKEALGEGCRKGILSLSHRAPNPYLTFELMLDGKGIGFAQNIVFSDEHLKSLLAKFISCPNFAIRAMAAPSTPSSNRIYSPAGPATSTAASRPRPMPSINAKTSKKRMI